MFTRQSVFRMLNWVAAIVMILSFALTFSQSVFAAPSEPTQDPNISKELADALQFYYNEEYGKALPIFKSIADKIETMDLLFWLGTSAAKSGDYDLAIENFRKMLKQNPNLHRVRLELADALIQADRYDEARQELETVKAASPPEPVLRNIEKRIRFMDQRERKFRFNVLFAQGIQHDDNVASGPDTGDEIIIGGTRFNINPNDRKPRGNNWLTKFRADATYDIAKPGGMAWQVGTNIYNSYLLEDYNDFNFFYGDISTGPLYVGKQFVLKCPVGLADKYYANERVSNTFYVAPTLEHFYTSTFSVQSAYTFAAEDYTGVLEPSDNQLHRFALGPNFYLDKRRHILGGSLHYENRNAPDLGTVSYNAYGVDLTYFTKLMPKTELALRYGYQDRRYDDRSPLFNALRKDGRHLVNVAISQRFLTYLFASLEYTYIDNHSNIELYDYTKNMFTFNIGATYSR